MARNREKRKRRNAATGIVFTTGNYAIFGIALAVILLGYLALSQGPATSFSSLNIAPILLITGYCILVPLAILYQKSKSDTKAGD